MIINLIANVDYTVRFVFVFYCAKELNGVFMLEGTMRIGYYKDSFISQVSPIGVAGEGRSIPVLSCSGAGIGSCAWFMQVT